MKKRSVWLTLLSVLFILCLGAGVFAACEEKEEAPKASEYVDEINYYYGDGKDVHVQGWFPSLSDAMYTVTEEGDAIKLHYYNDTAWRNFGFRIDGQYSDFAWFNITMKRGASPVVAFVKVVNPIRESYDNPNVLGADVYFDITEEYVTYSFQIPSLTRQTMDIAEDVCLFPDPGTTGTAGDIYIKDAWFSKEQPEDGKWMNDTDSSNDAGWTAESWTNYSLRSAEDAEVRIGYNNPGEWAGAFRPIELPEEEVNKLTFVFSSDASGGTQDSVDNIVFSFRGDEASWNAGGWWNYYEQRLFVYNKGEAQADENGDITLEIPIAAALAAMEGQHEKQLLLGLNIESCPEFDNYDGKGQITIKSVTLSYEEGFTGPEAGVPEGVEWGIVDSGKGLYTLTVEGGVTNVSYANVPGNLWANLYANVPSGTTAAVAITIRNNGEAEVHYQLNFDGTMVGQSTIAAGETKTVEATPAGAYSTLNFFIDGCTNEADVLYSGNVDILSVEFTAQEEGLRWQGNSYTVTENADGVVNVTYTGMNPTGWTPLAAEVPADMADGPTVTILVRNNGTDTVKYKYSLDKSGAAVAELFGTIEGGATETLTLTADSYTTICLFFDCCYDPQTDTDMKDSYSGDLDILSVEFSGGSETPETPEEPEVSDLEVTWETDAAFEIAEGENGTTVSYENIGDWKEIHTAVTLEEKEAVITMKVTNNAAHKAKYKLSTMYTAESGWADVGGDNTAAVLYYEIEAGQTADLTITLTAAQAAQAEFLMFMIDVEDVGGGANRSGSLVIGSLTVAYKAAQEQPDTPVQLTPVDVTWGTDDSAFTLQKGENGTTVDYTGVNSWQNVNAALTLSEGQTTVVLKLTNNADHKVKYKLSFQDANWQQIGADDSAACAWAEVESGETVELTLTFTADQAAQAAHLMLMIDCWENGTAYSGSTVLVSVSVG